MRTLNRAAIRAAKKNADKIAAVLAENALQPNGRNGFVSNPTARKVLARGLPPEEARDAIEVRMLADLARLCNVPGYPVSEGTK